MNAISAQGSLKRWSKYRGHVFRQKLFFC